MAKRPRTAKQLANDQRLRDRKGQKAVESPTPPPVAPITEGATPVKKTIEVDAELIQTLMAKVEELEKTKNPAMSPEAALIYTAQVQGFNTNLGANGVQGRIFRYPVEKSYYTDPTERLYEEERLRRFGLRENFFFDWDVEGVEYEKYNVTYAEPRFTIRLFRRVFAEDGITETGQMALVNRQIMHEDEVVARAAADKLGMADKFESFQDMMSEMRYYRIRQWLLDLFTPPTVRSYATQSRPMVIDGKVVEMFDTESLIDKGSAEAKSATISSEVRI